MTKSQAKRDICAGTFQIVVFYRRLVRNEVVASIPVEVLLFFMISTRLA